MEKISKLQLMTLPSLTALCCCIPLHYGVPVIGYANLIVSTVKICELTEGTWGSIDTNSADAFSFFAYTPVVISIIFTVNFLLKHEPMLRIKDTEKKRREG